MLTLFGFKQNAFTGKRTALSARDTERELEQALNSLGGYVNTYISSPSGSCSPYTTANFIQRINESIDMTLKAFKAWFETHPSEDATSFITKFKNEHSRFKEAAENKISLLSSEPDQEILVDYLVKVGHHFLEAVSQIFELLYKPREQAIVILDRLLETGKTLYAHQMLTDTKVMALTNGGSSNLLRTLTAQSNVKANTAASSFEATAAHSTSLVACSSSEELIRAREQITSSGHSFFAAQGQFELLPIKIRATVNNYRTSESKHQSSVIKNFTLLLTNELAEFVSQMETYYTQTRSSSAVNPSINSTGTAVLTYVKLFQNEVSSHWQTLQADTTNSASLRSELSQLAQTVKLLVDRIVNCMEMSSPRAITAATETDTDVVVRKSTL